MWKCRFQYDDVILKDPSLTYSYALRSENGGNRLRWGDGVTGACSGEASGVIQFFTPAGMHGFIFEITTVCSTVSAIAAVSFVMGMSR